VAFDPLAGDYVFFTRVATRSSAANQALLGAGRQKAGENAYVILDQRRIDYPSSIACETPNR
jgi:hypothetical protein